MYLEFLSAVFNICFSILSFLQTHIPGEQSCGSSEPSKLELCSVAIFSLGRTFESLDALPISDRFPVEQVQTPGGQASDWTAESWASFNFSVIWPQLAEWM